jgi:hypothetical protein
MIETRKREHSRKPDEQYPLIEACSPGPYLEMFARYAQSGWVVWGDESQEEVVPRGRVHKGYEGGDINVPQLPLFGRLSRDEQDQVAYTLKEAYEAGRSIREISSETEYSIGRVRSLLERADTRFRARGAQKSTDAISASGDD